jgi:uncharacterized membrane protein YgdD (TMEM256/DUF423 family)
MNRTANFVTLGAALAALGVAFGAFGAHGLRGVVSAEALGFWETGTRYWLYGALGTLAFGVWRRERATSGWPGLLLVCGSVLFGGSLYAMALGGPRWLGAVTPLGGLGLILGFSLFAWAAARTR